MKSENEIRMRNFVPAFSAVQRERADAQDVLWVLVCEAGCSSPGRSRDGKLRPADWRYRPYLRCQDCYLLVLATLQLVLLAVLYVSPQWDLVQEKLPSYDVVFEVTLAFTNVVGLFVNALLLMGVGKGKAKLVFPAVIYYFLFVCLYCVVLIAFFILYVSKRRATVSGVEILVFSLLLFFPAKILTYFWLVVYSCYRQMKRQEP